MIDGSEPEKQKTVQGTVGVVAVDIEDVANRGQNGPENESSENFQASS